MADIKSIDSHDFGSETVLLRADLNVPVKDGVVTDATRIEAALPSIRKISEDGGKVVVVSHLGRPKGTGFQPEFSLAPVARELERRLGRTVKFREGVIDENAASDIESLSDGDILLLDNVRFDKREKGNDQQFAKMLASFADSYVNDAFGTAHRAHASTEGVAKLLPSYAGYLMQREVETLSSMLDDPKRPFVAILGGSKVSDKISVIDSLLDKCDVLLIGGAMCFTFLKSQGLDVGASLVEDDWTDAAMGMLEKAKQNGVELLLPVDVVVAKEIEPDAATEVVDVDAMPSDMMGLDIGPRTCGLYSNAISNGKCVFWNGPMGVFELAPFEEGTKAVAQAVASNKDADTIIGGGDSVAAVNKFGLRDEMTFISTGGGASMELVEGKVLPGVAALEA